jgi:serine/threonine-protein kinase
MTPKDGSTDETLTPSEVTDRPISETVPATIPEARTTRDTPRGSFGSYLVGDVIGRGGMGEVLLARDPKIGRNVAIKRMRGSSSVEAVERFLREAKIQARLDHPAIAPVYELDRDSEGQPFFTMKRLAGTTLQDRLDAKAPIQPLLRAFVDVCLAIDFAHARGVVHRDLKPPNVMLGDYGEVYVLDWGVARVVADRESSTAQPDISTLEGQTQAGAILGTPGYMAPEQLRGEAEVGPPADVYSLGCILFEILAGQALHPQGKAALATTIANPTESPARRAPDRAVAPELDTVCVAALAEAADVRPTARQLADRVQRYLDGDRDVERRRVVAAEQVELARADLASGDPDRRRHAAQAAGRALAFDPDNDAAVEMVTSLVLAPPRELPDELVRQLDAEEIQLDRIRSRSAIKAYLSLLLWAPMLAFVHVADWGLVIGILLAGVGMAVIAWLNARTGRVPFVALVVGNSVFALVFSRLAGPFVITPSLVCGIALAIASRSKVGKRPWIVAVWAMVAMLAPFAFEYLGVFASTWRMTPEGLLNWGSVIDSHGTVDTVNFIAGNVGIVVVVALYAAAMARDRYDAQRRARVQAWHLEQLIPRASQQRQLAQGAREPRGRA